MVVVCWEAGENVLERCGWKVPTAVGVAYMLPSQHKLVRNEC